MKRKGKRAISVRYGQNNTRQSREEAKLNRLFRQVIASALLFLLVFAGGGLIPSDVVDVFGAVGETIRGESSLFHAVEALGDAVKRGEDWHSALTEVFLPMEESSDRSVYWEVGESYRKHLHPTAWID